MFEFKVGLKGETVDRGGLRAAPSFLYIPGGIISREGGV